MYTPSPEILKKYADVLIKFALWSGNGVQPGDVVVLQVPECAKAILKPLQIAVLEAKAHPMIHYIPEGVGRSFYEHASDEQINFMPKEYLLSRVNVATHFVSIIATDDKYELQGIDPKKIMQANKAAKFYMDARRDKEDQGKLTWTLGLFGTDAMAADANMSTEEYWDEIIKACFLDEADPIAKWKHVFTELETIRTKLNALKIDWLHVAGADVDLHVQIGRNRQWLGGSGRNIPSFELFISPDWRGTHGTIKFNQPLYRYGNLIEGIELTFKDGLVTEAKATKNEEMLKEMLAVENANKIGEYSLTDKRYSRITRFMGETLFDENMGGEFGNTHLAVGMAYRDSYDKNVSEVSEAQWQEMGFNDSVVHTDIISTTDRIVTATLEDGTNKVIYKDGMFQV